MPAMTLSVPDDLYTVIKQHNEIKWSVIARNAMWEYARKIQLVDSILEKSELTEKDAAEIGKLIKKSIREQHDIECLVEEEEVFFVIPFFCQEHVFDVQGDHELPEVCEVVPLDKQGLDIALRGVGGLGVDGDYLS